MTETASRQPKAVHIQRDNHNTPKNTTDAMADEEVATKAPESDAAEQSIFPGDTRAQEGASMGVSSPHARSVENLNAECVF